MLVISYTIIGELTILCVVVFYAFYVTIIVSMFVIVFNFYYTPIIQIGEFVCVRIYQWI